jgi:hypothetical protein
MNRPPKWYERRRDLEARRTELEHQASALLRADARKKARRPKPSPPTSPQASSLRWLPLADLKPALRARERAARS